MNKLKAKSVYSKYIVNALRIVSYVLAIVLVFMIKGHLEDGLRIRSFLGPFCLLSVTLLITNEIDLSLNNIVILRQKKVLFFFSGAFLLLFMVRSWGYFRENEENILATSIFLFSIYLVLLAIRIIFKSKQIEFPRVNASLLILLAVTVLLWLPMAGFQPRWDSAIFYRQIINQTPFTVFNPYAMSFASHTTQIHYALCTMMGLIVGDNISGIEILNLLTMVLGIISVNKLIAFVFPEKKNIEITFLTSIYAFSPFILSLSSYKYSDYWLISLMAIVIWTAISKQWIFHFFVSMIMCFAKETAVISYAGFCLGLLIYELSKEKRLSTVLCHKYWYGMLTVGLSWLWMYIKLPKWGGGILNLVARIDNSNSPGIGSNWPVLIAKNNYIHAQVGWDSSFIIYKLLNLLVLNFSWLLMVFTIYGIVNCVKNKNYKLLGLLISVIISDVFLTIFYFTFKTYNHAKYLDGHVACLLICGIIGIGLINNKWFRNASIIATSMVLLISNFVTFDPLTLFAYTDYDMGNTTMISTSEGNEFFSDSMGYNRQYLFVDKTLNRAIAEVIDEENVCVYLPLYNGSTMYFEGKMAQGSDGDLMEALWNPRKKCRMSADVGDNIVFNQISISDISVLNSTIGDYNGYFFCMPSAGWDILKDLEESGLVEDEKTFGYMGIEITRAKLMVRN